MIYENEAGINVIQFGTGDIEVCNGRVPDSTEKEMMPCVIFAKKEPGEIGAYTDPDAVGRPATIKDNAHTMMVFTDIRSFDVVIGNLQQAKERFQKNGTAILSMQGITDEVPSQEYS